MLKFIPKLFLDAAPSTRCIALTSALLALACTPKSADKIAAPVPPTVAHKATEPDPLEARLVELSERLEAARKEHHVAGMAVAVVKGDSVIFARGFGLADIEKGLKATPQTMFAIGSSTKAFTATTIGMLKDEGKISWDDALTQHVPEFVLAVDSDDKAATATIRDASCHRTGFSRMGVLWASGDVPRNTFLAQASHAKPFAKFRKKFLYNNVTYAAAGEASARVAKSTWAQLVTTRILQPLGMNHSTVSAAAAQSSGALAQGYKWREEEKEFEALPMRDLKEIAPAGAINSNVLDMSQWLRFQLADGTVAGKRLLEAKTLAETRKVQFNMSPEKGYGMGWFIEQWNGKKMLHHGGNIDGYAAMVAFVPEADIGVVLLTNVSYTPLQNTVASMVFDTLLGEPAANDPGADEDFSGIVGSYIANFGPFKEANFKVTEQDGVLFVDVPGQTNYELKAAQKDGRRPFVVTDTIKVSFAKASDGSVNVMRLHQGGMDFEILRKGYTPPVEIPLAELAKYLGTYSHAKLGDAQVKVQHNRLAIDIPKQMTYELSTPDKDNKWRFRIKPDIALVFGPNNEKPTEVTLHQDGKAFVFKRTGSASSHALPSLAQLQRRRRAAKAEKILARGIIKFTGTVDFEQAGVTGTIEGYYALDGRFSSKLDLGAYGHANVSLSTTKGWEESSFSPPDTLTGNRLQQLLLSQSVTWLRDWTKIFDTAIVLDATKHDGADSFTLKMVKGDLPPYTVTVDAKTGHVVMVKYNVIMFGSVTMPTTERFSDYRKAMGVRLPFKVTSETPASGRLTMSFDKIERYKGDAELAFPSSPPTK